MSASTRSGVADAGPIVATIFVLRGTIPSIAFESSAAVCRKAVGPSGTAAPRERVPARIDRAVAELFFDPEELVVLRHPVRPRRRAGLDLTHVRCDREIRDRRVLRL